MSKDYKEITEKAVNCLLIISFAVMLVSIFVAIATGTTREIRGVERFILGGPALRVFTTTFFTTIIIALVKAVIEES